MKLSLFFSNSLYNCEAIIKDISGIKKYVTNFEEKQSDFLEIDVESSSFELTVIPKMPDYKSAFLDMEVQNWKDRLAQKVGNALCSTLDKMLLRVGCTYMISDTKENDIICICGQEYILERLINLIYSNLFRWHICFSKHLAMVISVNVLTLLL